MGIQQMLLGAKVGISGPPPSWGTFGQATSPTPTTPPAEIRFGFFSDGTVIVRNYANVTLFSGNWFKPTTLNIGDNYWWRASYVSGANPAYSASLVSDVRRTGPAVLGQWYQMTSSPAIRFGANGTANTGYVEGQHLVEISTDSLGTEIVASWPISWGIETAL